MKKCRLAVEHRSRQQLLIVATMPRFTSRCVPVPVAETRCHAGVQVRAPRS
jgi:hypothetical protein